MTISVEAGLGFEAAMVTAAKNARVHSPQHGGGVLWCPSAQVENFGELARASALPGELTIIARMRACLPPGYDATSRIS